MRFEFTATTLPPQLHASSVTWNGEFNERPIDGLIGHAFKPMFGFWTSSERGDGGTAWLDLCRDPERSNIRVTEVHRFVVVGQPRIWVLIDDKQLIDAAIELQLLPDYSEALDWRQYENVGDHQTLDDWIKQRMEVLLDCGEFWGAFRLHADAVHVPIAAKFNGPWLSSFEVESTCWFEPGKHLQRVRAWTWL